MNSILALCKKYEPLFRFVEVCAMVAGVLIALMQLKDIKIQKSAELAIKFNDYLDEKTNSKIAETIENGKPLFNESGKHGPFSKSDVQGYLGVYETLADLFSRNLISRGMVHTNFSFDILKAYQNSEVQKLIKNDQSVDPESWTGFQKMATKLQKN